MREITASEGVRCLLKGIRVGLLESRVRKQLLKSLIVNGVVFLLLMVGLIWAAFSLTAGLVTEHPEWWPWVDWIVSKAGWLLRVAFIAGALVVGPPIFSIILGVILPMFMSPVFRAGREFEGAALPEEASEGIGAEVRTIIIDIRRLIRLLLFSLLILPLNLLPVVGQIGYVILQIMLAAHTLGWDILGRHFELYGLGYQEQRIELRKNRRLVISLGLVGGVLLLIPIANILFVTTNAAGAGVLSARLDQVPASSETS
jgi:uncharacterized protein involved in cysteine biosynthesis